MRLIEKAKQAHAGRSKRKFNQQELLELALAFSRKEITSGQVAAAIGTKSNVYTLLASTLMFAARRGEVRVQMNSASAALAKAEGGA